MKGKFFCGLAIFLLLCAGSSAWANSIDYLDDQSAEYVRSLSRNAALDASDIIVYNPAGTAFLKEGFYINGSNQTILKYYEIDNGTETYESDKPSPIIPSLFALYVQDQWSAFAAMTAPAGGGTLDYEDGNNVFSASPNTVEMTSLYYGFTFGGAYAINDMLSFSLSARYIYSIRAVDINVGSGAAETEVEQTAQGICGIIGVDFKPNDRLNISLHYESETKLEFENDTDVNTLGMAQFNDGVKSRRDLPALLAGGVSYSITPELTASMSFYYFMIKQANTDDAYDNYDNGWDISGAVAYQVSPQFLCSAGYMYSKSGANEDTVSDFDITLDAHNFGIGFRYTPIENLHLNVGYQYVYYIDQENAAGSVEYRKAVHVLALGAEYKVF